MKRPEEEEEEEKGDAISRRCVTSHQGFIRTKARVLHLARPPRFPPGVLARSQAATLSHLSGGNQGEEPTEEIRSEEPKTAR